MEFIRRNSRQSKTKWTAIKFSEQSSSDENNRCIDYFFFFFFFCLTNDRQENIFYKNHDESNLLVCTLSSKICRFIVEKEKIFANIT